MNCALITTLLIDKTSVVIIMMRLMLRDHNMCVYVCVRVRACVSTVCTTVYQVSDVDSDATPLAAALQNKGCSL